ncbi:MAG: response regulator transcription factor [Campylobacteraceae bacterium]|nr:response regulator transcription factor [Campylobacteraceae bacterium]
MRILIVENETYLAQSIANKLSSLGHSCEILTRLKDVLEAGEKDAVLLSTNIFGEDIYKVIDKFKNSIIILLISYISHDTVSKPIKAGANDYIQKPFMVEELIRKLEHFKEFDRLKSDAQALITYLEYHFSSFETQNAKFKNLTFPLFINSQNAHLVDKFVYELSKEIGNLKIFNLADEKSFALIQKEEKAMYLLGFQYLDEEKRRTLYKIIEDKKAVIACKEELEIPYRLITLENNKELFSSEILSIDEYFKYVITNFQEVFSDTDLAKKLGISRKSLWERRKKYGIQK